MKDRRIWIIFLIVFINLLGFGIILPLLPYYGESLGATPLQIGFLAAIYSLFQLLSAPILGELSDKIGRRPILLFSLAGTALSFFILGAAKTLPLLFLSRIIDGASGGNISTAQAYIADITSKENRTQGMGFLMAAFSLGFILGPAVGGVLSRFSYSLPSYVAGAVALLATVLTYFYLPESLHKKEAVEKENKKKKLFFSAKDFYDVFTHPNVGVVITISFFMMLAFSLMQGTFALFTAHVLHLTPEDNGYLFAYLGFIGIAIQMFLLKPIMKYIPENIVVTVGLFMMAVSLVLLGYAFSLPMLVLAITLLAFANSVANPILAGLVSKLTPDDEQGNIMGISQSVGSVARLIGPVVGTLMYQQIGVRSPYVFGAAILGITALGGLKYLQPKR